QPAPRDRDRAAALEGDVVRGEAAREDRDDREADREVLKSPHRAEELLRVAKLVQRLLVVRQFDLTGSSTLTAHACPSLVDCLVGSPPEAWPGEWIALLYTSRPPREGEGSQSRRSSRLRPKCTPSRARTIATATAMPA